MSIFDQFYINLLNTSYWELIAALTGIGSVWFARKENILVYPIGIISVVIYVFICFNAQLYGDAGINFFYAVVSLYGWYNWTHKNGKVETLEISINKPSEQFTGILLTILSFVGVLLIIRYFNRDNIAYLSSPVQYIDSLTTALFIIGMWQMALKRVENWIYWIIGDIISIPLYFYKGLVFTSFQYMVFLIIAIMGYIEWRKRWVLINQSALQ
jgi:nicotinamide mononucleotide transporter